MLSEKGLGGAEYEVCDGGGLISRVDTTGSSQHPGTSRMTGGVGKRKHESGTTCGPMKE